jgi:hypothetical protein
MNYRKVTIHPAESLDAAGTKTIDIRGTDVISRILIKYIITKGVADHTMAAPLAADITKIELVDGSEVLFGMTGYEAQALNIYDRKCGTMNQGQQMASCAGTSFYGLDFGRFLHDPVLALDPRRFTNLQLKISYTLTGSAANCAASSLEVFSDVFDEKVVSPIGFLMSKECYSYTVGDDGTVEYIDLPTDYPFRKMLVRAYLDAYEPDHVIESIRLDEDNLKRIPLDISLKTYIDMMMGEWTPVEELFSCIVFTHGSAERVYYMTPTNEFPSIAGLGTPGTLVLGSPSGWMRGGKVTLVSENGGQNIYGIVHGFCPNHCVEFPFGNPLDMDDWYDVTKIDSLKLRLEANAAGTAQVVLQQLRKY